MHTAKDWKGKTAAHYGVVILLDEIMKELKRMVKSFAPRSLTDRLNNNIEIAEYFIKCFFIESQI